ncbi:MAG: Crp/Fnr family transcriptional regulator [Cyclobacteriaceae bacterium]|nr:Crp/Fnr family transcriptional regulator [Cyclobacteriaceae bacterium SS2]
MMDMFSLISSMSPLSSESLDEFRNITTQNDYPKGHSLLDFNQVDRHFHFIVKGSGRVYYLRNGIDITDYIAMDGQFFGGLESLFTKEPSHKAMELTEDSTIQSFPFDQFEKLCLRYHDIETLCRKMATFAFLECQRRIEAIRFFSAAERYELLEKKYPGISNRIPLKHIASYLGTTQVSLSRIRAGVQ